MEIAAERAEAAQTADEFKVYSDAVARHSRGGRITLALEAKIVRDTAAFRREVNATEREHRAQRELERASRLETFLEEPIDHAVERLKTIFGLVPVRRRLRRAGPRPPPLRQPAAHII